ncbi:hypothetical protein H0H92_015272, partial [Tricholoma furcatifolium]
MSDGTFPAKLSNIEEAATFLSSICPNAIKNNPDNGLGSAESFACLLYRRPGFINRINAALVERDLETIWSLFLDHVRSQRRFPLPLRDSNDVMRITSNLKNLVTGRLETPLWTLAPASDAHSPGMVKHHTLSSLAEMKGRPEMLLYDLGSFKEDPMLNERVEKLFQTGKNTFLVNASATGKTRLLYEGLTRYWGIYATIHADAKESKALEMT